MEAEGFGDAVILRGALSICGQQSGMRNLTVGGGGDVLGAEWGGSKEASVDNYFGRFRWCVVLHDNKDRSGRKEERGYAEAGSTVVRAPSGTTWISLK